MNRTPLKICPYCKAELNSRGEEFYCRAIYGEDEETSCALCGEPLDGEAWAIIFTD